MDDRTMLAAPVDEPPNRSLAALLEATGREDREAFAALYDTTCARVHGVSVRMLGVGPGADELTISTYHALWLGAAEQYVARLGDPLRWLLVLTHAAGRQRLRAAEITRKPADFDVPTLTVVPPERQVATVVSERTPPRSPDPERLRLVLERMYFEGLSLADAASTLGLTPAETSRLIAQAMRERAGLGGPNRASERAPSERRLASDDSPGAPNGRALGLQKPLAS